MISYEELDAFGLLKRFVKGWIVRANQVGVDELAALSSQELVDMLGDHLLLCTSQFGRLRSSETKCSILELPLTNP